MLFWSIKFPEYYTNLNLFNLNFNTFCLIFCTSSLLILFSFITNFGNRNIKSKFLNLVSNLSISGYAIPGIIISVSIITFISFLSNYLGINIKTVFIGSFIGLIFGYFFRFYSISYNGIKSNYIKINYSIDEGAYLIGYNKFDTFSKIHWPIMRNNIFFIFILISLEIIKELPITLILRPFNFETFSTKAYNFASQDLIEAAAIPSIFLIFWASMFILISFKYFFQNDK
jgi:iron(III) transport system permease protein